MADPLTQKDLITALPSLSGEQHLQDLESQVFVHRDDLGIPHARAVTSHDAFFAQGFFTAQDRLWQMDWDRRRAYGRSAESLGPDAVEQDIFLRRMGLEASAKADYAAVNDNARAMLDAYAEGVNAFIASSKHFAVEYQLLGEHPAPWHPWDGLAIFKVRHLFMGTFEFKMWRARLLGQLGPERAAQLFTDHRAGGLLIIPTGGSFGGQSSDASDLRHVIPSSSFAMTSDSEPIDAGSNNWALAGTRTASGRPLLAGDPHRGPDTPNVYYQNHIACDDFDVIGLSFAGLPGFHHFGHNRSVAWCVTHTAADYQDLFVERFNPQDSGWYEFEGSLRKVTRRQEAITVRGGERQTVDVIETHHGPVVFGDPTTGTAVSIRYSATAEPGRWPEAILDMMSATDVDTFEDCMRPWVDPCNNMLCADVHGNISYQMRGKLPMRSQANSWGPVPGWTGEHEWKGYVPFEEVPRSRNPTQGYIVTANNRVIGADYPHYISNDFTPDYRARALNERLSDLTGADVADMESLHAIRTSLLARNIVPALLRATPAEGDQKAAVDLLNSWDYSMDAGSAAATVYSATMTELLRSVGGVLIGEDLASEMLSGTGRGAPSYLRTLKLMVGTAVADDDRSLIGGSSWEPILRSALCQAVAWLHSQLGNDPAQWLWGTLHRTSHSHPLSAPFPEHAALLDPPSVPCGGDAETPQQGAYTPGNPFVLTSCSVARYVYDLSDWGNSRWVVPLGSSGHPGSRHYADQMESWASTKTYPMLYDWDVIENTANTTSQLLP